MKWKCQSCDEKFETEKELQEHQTDSLGCMSCCHIYCKKCKGIEPTICCQCGRENWQKGYKSEKMICEYDGGKIK